MSRRDDGYIPALTGLRGVAAWWVVVYHFSDPLVNVVPDWVLGFVRHGYLAVDLFFVLSGYVIYITSGYSLVALGRRSVSKFLLNRLIRIYPLHIVLMMMYLLNPLALWLFSSSGVEEGRYAWDYYFASIFLVQNWGLFDHLQWNIPAWSISTEFAAYIICPFLISLSVSRLVSVPLKLVSLMVFLIFLTGTIFLFSGRNSIGDDITTMGLIRCVLEFWIGLCLGGVCRDLQQATGRELYLHTIAIIIILMASVFMISFGVRNYFFVPGAVVLVIYIIAKGDWLFSKILACRGIHYFGLISYSTYLVHFFVKDWVKFLSENVSALQLCVYLVMCFFASVMLYGFVEAPARRVLRRKLMSIYD